MASPTTTDQKSNWETFYRETVSHHFNLPAEMELVGADYTVEAIMGSRYLVSFCLPATKSPQRWLTQIAAASGFPKTYRKGKHLYDCSGECHLLRRQYFPATDLYKAQWG